MLFSSKQNQYNKDKEKYNLAEAIKDNYANRKHKNDVFCDLFSQKECAISLFNALNKTQYTNPVDLEIITLSDAIYMQLKNDVSIMFQNEMHLWEHQSTVNENMSLRGLVYFAHNIDGVLNSRGIVLYGKEKVKIPSPEYYVFYNGREDIPDRQKLKLSDSFIVPRKGYEWTANVLNINPGHNKKLLKDCPMLKGYSMLVYYIRKYQKEKNSLEEAIRKAIDRCIEEDYLKQYLLKKKAEVRAMLLTEFDQEAYEKLIRSEAENRVNQLNLYLISEKRFDDLKRAVNDREYQLQLFQEYGL